MRLNIKSIISVVGCDERIAHEIEDYVDNNNLLDWSECTDKQLERVVLSAARLYK